MESASEEDLASPVDGNEGSSSTADLFPTFPATTLGPPPIIPALTDGGLNYFSFQPEQLDPELEAAFNAMIEADDDQPPPTQEQFAALFPDLATEGDQAEHQQAENQQARGQQDGNGFEGADQSSGTTEGMQKSKHKRGPGSTATIESLDADVLASVFDYLAWQSLAIVAGMSDKFADAAFRSTAYVTEREQRDDIVPQLPIAGNSTLHDTNSLDLTESTTAGASIAATREASADIPLPSLEASDDVPLPALEASADVPLPSLEHTETPNERREPMTPVQAKSSPKMPSAPARKRKGSRNSQGVLMVGDGPTGPLETVRVIEQRLEKKPRYESRRWQQQNNTAMMDFHNPMISPHLMYAEHMASANAPLQHPRVRPNISSFSDVLTMQSPPPGSIPDARFSSVPPQVAQASMMAQRMMTPQPGHVNMMPQNFMDHNMMQQQMMQPPLMPLTNNHMNQSQNPFEGFGPAIPFDNRVGPYVAAERAKQAKIQQQQMESMLLGDEAYIEAQQKKAADSRWAKIKGRLHMESSPPPSTAPNLKPPLMAAMERIMNGQGTPGDFALAQRAKAASLGSQAMLIGNQHVGMPNGFPQIQGQSMGWGMHMGGIGPVVPGMGTPMNNVGTGMPMSGPQTQMGAMQQMGTNAPPSQGAMGPPQLPQQFIKQESSPTTPQSAGRVRTGLSPISPTPGAQSMF